MKRTYSRYKINMELLKLAWPTIAEQLLLMSVGIVSTILISRIGKDALAGVGMVNILLNFFQTIFAGLATGSTVVVARVIGESGIKNAKNVLVQSILIGFFIGIAFLIFGFSTDNLLLKFFFNGADPVVLKIALQYYKITLVGIPFIILDLVIGGSLRGSGDTKSPMYITIIVNIINVIMSISLIYGVHFGTLLHTPALGVFGDALGSTIARICGGIMIGALLLRKNTKIHFDKGDKFIIDFKVIERIIKIGIPSFLENLIMQGGMLIMQVFIVTLGTAAIAGYQVGNNIHQIAVMPVMGIATIANTTVGQSLGKENYELAEIYSTETNRLAIILGITSSIIIFIFAEPIARLYSNDPSVIQSSVIVARGFAMVEPLLGIERVNASVMRSAGDIKYVIITAVIALWIFRVLTTEILTNYMHLGLYGVATGIFLDFCVRGSMYTSRRKKGKWKYLKV